MLMISVLAQIKWLVLAGLTVHIGFGLRWLAQVCRTRSHTSRLLGGIPRGTARAMLRIHWRAVGPFGRRVITKPIRRLVHYAVGATILSILAAVSWSPLFLLASIIGWTHL